MKTKKVLEVIDCRTEMHQLVDSICDAGWTKRPSAVIKSYTDSDTCQGIVICVVACNDPAARLLHTLLNDALTEAEPAVMSTTHNIHQE